MPCNDIEKKINMKLKKKGGSLLRYILLLILFFVYRYYELQWLASVGPRSFSVFGNPRRTNNSQESFHRTLIDLIGQCHPNIWAFTGMQSGKLYFVSLLIEFHCSSGKEHISSKRFVNIFLHNEHLTSLVKQTEIPETE